MAITTVIAAWPWLRPGGSVVAFDTITYSGPNFVVSQNGWSAGRIPQWNDTIFGGVPHLANPQAAVFSPLKALALMGDTGAAYEWSTVASLVILAVGTYLFFAGAMRVAPPAAAVGSVALLASGVIVRGSVQFEQIAAMAAIPWVLAAVEMIARGSSRRAWIGAGGLATGFLMVAGHPQQAYVGAGVIGAYGLGRSVDLARHEVDHRIDWRTAGRTLGAILLSLGLGLVIGAIQLLPAVAMSSYSLSGDLDLSLSASTTGRVLEASGITSTLVGNPHGTVFDATSGFETTAYVGMTVLALAAVGLASNLRRSSRWGATSVLLVVGTIVALFLSIGPRCKGTLENTSCGRSGFVYQLAEAVVPVFDQQRVAARWLLVPAFALAILAAIGVDAIVRQRISLRATFGSGGAMIGFLIAMLVAFDRNPPTSEGSVQIALAVAALVGGILMLQMRSVRLVAVVALVLAPTIELIPPLRVGYGHLTRSDSTFDDFESALLDPLVGEPGRVLSLPEFKIGDNDYITTAAPANFTTVYGLRTIDGYDGGVQVTKQWFETITAVLGRTIAPLDALWFGEKTTAEPELLARYGIRWVVVDTPTRAGYNGFDPTTEEGLQSMRDVLVPGFGPPIATDGDLELFENPSWTGIATVYFEPETRQADFSSQLHTLAPQAVVTGEPFERSRCGASCTNDVAVRRPRPERFEITTSGDAGVLAISEQHLPGWTATVDRTDVVITTTNGFGMGIPVPDGDHDVVLRYRSPGLPAGIVVSIVGLLVAISLLLSMVLGPLRTKNFGQDGRRLGTAGTA